MAPDEEREAPGTLTVAWERSSSTAALSLFASPAFCRRVSKHVTQEVTQPAYLVGGVSSQAAERRLNCTRGGVDDALEGGSWLVRHVCDGICL